MEVLSTELSAVNVFIAAIELLIMGILLQAGFSKLSGENQSYYAKTIQTYGVRSQAVASLLPRLIGAVELIICALILVPISAKLGVLLAGSLFGIYFFAFVKQILQGKADMNCGCGGPGADLKISPMLLLRNAALIGLCWFAISTQTVSLGIAWVLVIPLAAALGLVYLSSDQLIANQQKIQILGNS
jgi:hypothetical protein